MKSLVIIRDRDKRLTGYLYSLAPAGQKAVLQEAFAAPEHPADEERLRAVHARFAGKKCDSIVFVPCLPDALFMELLLPATPYGELRDSLEFELPRQLPCRPDGMTWAYRPVENRNGFTRVRIMALRNGDWEEIIRCCLAAGISIDAICHPYLAVESRRDEEDIYFPELSDFTWRRAAGEPVPLRELQYPPSPEPSSSAAAELVAEYALTGHFLRDRKCLGGLPAKLRPQRLRPLKAAVAAAAVAAAALTAGLGYRVWDDRQGRLDAVAGEISDIEHMIHTQLEVIGRVQVAGAAAAGILRELDDVEAEELLNQLSGNLLTNAWVTAFRSGNRKASLTIMLRGETEPVVHFLSRNLRGYTVESLRQQLNHDGGQLLNVTLSRLESMP